MAANYWDSTQRRCWLFTKEQLGSMRQRLEDEDTNLVQMFPLPQLRHLNIYFNQQINRLGKRLAVRQQAMATAQLYMKRFYCKVEVRRTNPFLVMATAVYLACKMEECPQHIRVVISEAKSLWPEYHCLEISKLGECEFFLISEMNSQMIVHQPYRTLTTLQADLNLGQEEVALAWSAINDHYMTDLPLLYPPHVIALTAVLLGLVLRPPVPGGGNASSVAAAAAAATLAQAQARAAIQNGGNGSAAIAGISAAIAGAQAAGAGAGAGQAGDASPRDKAQQENRSKVQRFAVWLADSNVDIEAMVDCTQELVAFYECHEQYNDKMTREQITRFIKARGLDR